MDLSLTCSYVMRDKAGFIKTPLLIINMGAICNLYRKNTENLNMGIRKNALNQGSGSICQLDIISDNYSSSVVTRVTLCLLRTACLNNV